MTTLKDVAGKWATVKPRVIALAIGLIAGPLISNFIGWQMTASAARAQLRDGLVGQAALFCEQRARSEVKEPAALDWRARNDLANRWAVVPGAAAPDSAISYECARKLGS